MTAASSTELANRLRAGCAALSLDLDDDAHTRLLRFMDLLLKWNKVYNLTAVRDPAEMLTHHLLDSLSVVEPLRRQTDGRAIRLLDVGSGGGLPGVVLAICSPHIGVSCVDAVGKKAAFVRQVAATLALPNLKSLHARVEALTDRYDVVCSRAFASLADFTAWSRGALADGGAWMAMKGKRPDDELAALPPAIDVFHVEPLHVPDLQAERCLVWMRPARST